MRHHQTGIAGTLGIILFLGLAATAAAQDAAIHGRATATLTTFQAPVTTAERIVREVSPSSATKLSAPMGGDCVEMIASATELIFSDGFASGESDAWGPGAVAQFSAVRMLDLNLTVRFVEGFTGDHLLTVKLMTPKGHDYQTTTIPITSAIENRGSLRRVDGYPRPLAVRVAETTESSKSPEVTVSFPVGGTPIVTSSLFGTWTAEASLDEGGVCASVHFELTP